MEYALAGVRADVRDQAPSSIDPGTDLPRQTEELPGHFRVVLSQVGHGFDVILGDDQHVSRSLRVQVGKGQRSVVLRNDLSGDVPCRYRAEDAVVQPVVTPRSARRLEKSSSPWWSSNESSRRSLRRIVRTLPLKS